MNRLNPYRTLLLNYFKTSSLKNLSKDSFSVFNNFCEQQAEKLDQESEEKAQRVERYIKEYLMLKKSIVIEEEILERNGVNVDTDSIEMVEKIANRVGLTIRRT